MALSHVQVDTPMALVRAAAWCNSLARMGVHLPLFVIHDIGVMLSMTRGAGGYAIRAREAQLARIAAARRARSRSSTSTAALLENIGGVRGHRAARRAAAARRDGRRAAARASSATRTTAGAIAARRAGAEPLPLDLGILGEIDYADHFRDFDPRSAVGLHRAPRRAVDARLHAGRADRSRHRAPARPVQGGQRVGLARRSAARSISSICSPRSARPRPTTSRTSRSICCRACSRPGAPPASQTFAVDGYASIERKGNIDSLVLSELAYDREIFEQKVVDNELLYYGREKQREDERRLQYILIDCSASMRGQRQVFARGLALALIKKLTLEGDEIWVRFFDSRLHETIKVGRSGQVPVPYLLVVPQRARPQLRQGVPPAAGRGHAPAPRAEAPRRALHDHARPVSHRARADHRAQAAGVPLRHRRAARRATSCPSSCRCSIARRSCQATC